VNDRLVRLCFAAALLLGVLPLWVTKHLPLVDLPQHLFLISVLHRIRDPTTLYPQLFAVREQLTPYLGYYYAVHLLNWLVPVEVANKLFLSAYVIGMPLSLAFLLRSFPRPVWPCLLSIPFAYGDSFAWGFINYCSALPLAFFCCGFLVRSVSDARRRKIWAFALSVCLVLVLLSHVQVFAFLGLGLPWLLVMTRAPVGGRQGRLKALLTSRGPAVAAAVPAMLLFGVWVIARIGEPSQIEYGAPWKAWGPLLSSNNLAFKSLVQNRDEFFRVLGNMLSDGSDRYALYAVLLITLVAVSLGFVPGARDAQPGERGAERWRVLGLGALALGLYFLMPFDVRGYMYYLNTRYAHLAAPLLVCAVPPVRRTAAGRLLLASAICSLILAVPMSRGFREFGREASAVEELAALSSPRPLVMGLIFDPFSKAMTHPVYLHSAATIARERGGAPNFSFAVTPHSPVRYRQSPPPTFPSEWRPDQFEYRKQGTFYDHFLVRGVRPAQIFGPLLQGELAIAGQAGGFTLVRRR
jgi:hypothetical protein